ncbi:MAG: 50S ribosomal protein L5 [archaeon]
MNPNQEIRIEKVTLNIGAGKDQSRLDKGMILLETISGMKPVKTITQKRIAGWGIRPGLPIGCKVTLRKKGAVELARRLIAAKENRIMPSQFDNHGNIAFGIHEYIDIPDAKYIPEIGIIGLEVCITLGRAGFSIKRRRFLKKRIPKSHRISKDEAVEFMKKNFNLKTESEE